MRGLIRSPRARPPLLKPSREEIEAMRVALESSGVPKVSLV